MEKLKQNQIKNYLKVLFWGFLFTNVYFIYLLMFFLEDIFLKYPFSAIIVVVGITFGLTLINILTCFFVIIFALISAKVEYRSLHSILGWSYTILILILNVLGFIFFRNEFSTIGISLLFYFPTIIEFWGFSSSIHLNQLNGYNRRFFNSLAFISILLTITYSIDLWDSYDFSSLQNIYGLIFFIILAIIVIEILFQIFFNNPKFSIAAYTALRVLLFSVLMILSILWSGNIPMISKIPFLFVVFNTALALKYKSYEPTYGKMSYSL